MQWIQGTRLWEESCVVPTGSSAVTGASVQWVEIHRKCHPKKLPSLIGEQLLTTTARAKLTGVTLCCKMCLEVSGFCLKFSSAGVVVSVSVERSRFALSNSACAACFAGCSFSLSASLCKSVMSVFLIEPSGNCESSRIWKRWKNSSSAISHSAKGCATAQLINNPLNQDVTV